MHEHDAEYLAGEGRRQDRYVHPGGGFFSGAPAHSITVCGDDYLIGGRVSVPSLLAALRVLAPEIRRAYVATTRPPSADAAADALG